MNAAVTAGRRLAGPLPAALLPLTPAQYNAGTAGPVLKNARAALVQARGLLQSARQDAVACRDASQVAHRSPLHRGPEQRGPRPLKSGAALLYPVLCQSRYGWLTRLAL